MYGFKHDSLEASTFLPVKVEEGSPANDMSHTGCIGHAKAEKESWRVGDVLTHQGARNRRCKTAGSGDRSCRL